MKLNAKYVIFGCVLLLVLLLSMAGGCGAIPYSATTRSYAYVEGLETKAEFNASVNKLLDELEKMDENNVEMNQIIAELRTLDNGRGYDKTKLKAGLQALSTDESSKIYKRVSTFISETMPDQEGLENMSGSIDVFSSAVGNQNCVKTASGLSNSMGALCLSEEQLYMLQSRGGNSTGRDSQIGM
jgi:hypothetical protein